MELSKAQLKELTDSRSWERGLDYHQQGRVISMLEDKNTLIAKVAGTHDYNVKLRVKDDELNGSCDCPMGDAGVFCKHCVAVGLTYLEGGVDSARQPPSGQKAKAKKSKPAITLDDVREYLSGQEISALVEIIVEQMMEDEKLRDRLMFKAARSKQKGPDLAFFKQTINQATKTRGFVDYEAASGFARKINTVVDCIDELLVDGYAQEVIDLTEHALGRVEEALGEMDDSDGYMTPILERLQEIHHKACAKAEPDPEALARRLFEWELTTDWDTFGGAAETYADVLGEKGLAVYRSLAEAEWQKVPQLGPGQMERAYDHRRHRLSSIMEALACVDDDVESLVAVQSRDLSSEYRFLQIAQTYIDAGKPDQALEWAEKGLQAFPKNTDSRLREFLADEYQQRKRHAEAMQLIWANFAEHPHLENYKQLKKHADRAREWPSWRQQAIEYIRKTVAHEKKGRTQADRSWHRGADHSTLVQIFIWEKDVEAAWHQARTGGCSDDLWMQLAQLREKDHPADAIGVYQAHVDPLVQRTSNDAYVEAVRLIKKIGELAKGLGKQEEFAEYVFSLKTKFKAKRNFMKLLDRLR